MVVRLPVLERPVLEHLVAVDLAQRDIDLPWCQGLIERYALVEGLYSSCINYLGLSDEALRCDGSGKFRKSSPGALKVVGMSVYPREIPILL